ncbi:MAG: peptidylprolyl isomerase [Halodesulfurarchaeum sp.]
MVEEGRTAVIHYVARTVDDGGVVVDTTDVDVALESGVYDGNRDYEPLSFEVGAGEVLPGLDDAVASMDPGETRTVVLSPEEAYGERNEDLVTDFPRDEIEARSDVEAAVGELVTSDDGRSGWITDVTAETVTVDFNHEFAGERLEFAIDLLDVR